MKQRGNFERNHITSIISPLKHLDNLIRIELKTQPQVGLCGCGGIQQPVGGGWAAALNGGELWLSHPTHRGRGTQ